MLKNGNKIRFFSILIILLGRVGLFSHPWDEPAGNIVETVVFGLLIMVYPAAAGFKLKEKLFRNVYKEKFQDKNLAYIVVAEFVFLIITALVAYHVFKARLLWILLGSFAYLLLSINLSLLFLLGKSGVYRKRFFYALLSSLFVPVFSALLVIGKLLLIPGK